MTKLTIHRLAYTATALIALFAAAIVSAQDTAPNPGRPVGTVKAIAGSNVTLTTDAKAEVTVQVQDATKFLRLAPDQKDLRQATPVTFQDLQVGDRMLASGTA